MKRIKLNYLMLLIMAFSAISVNAHDFEVDGIYYNINGNEATVTYKGSSSPQYDEYSGSISIPETVTYNGALYHVTTIGAYAFARCSGLTSITIPNSVTSIGEGAFSRCFMLKTINISNSVTSIEVWTFYGCTSLTSFNIPNSVTSIGSSAFNGCTGLTSIVIPNSVKRINPAAFCRCENLSNIKVESGNAIYDSRNNCNAIIETASNTLNTCCKNTTIPNSVTSIGSNAFSGCTGLTSIVIPNSVTSIGYGAFNECSGLTSVVIPNSVTAIGDLAFNKCTGLTSIVIPNSVTSIGSSVFQQCIGLIRIDIGSSTTNIGDQTFSHCSGLKYVYCYSSIPPSCLDDCFPDYSATLHVPATSMAAYFTATCWENFENIIGDAVAPTTLLISNDSINLQLNEQLQLLSTVTPDNASYKEITWLSSDTTVATINNGMILAVGCGECNIIASCFGMQAVCHVLVANRITLDQQEAMLLPNHLLTLTPTPTVSGIYTVSSSDPTIAAARVLSSGKIQVVGIKEGATTITVGSADGTAIPATCLVTVYTEPGDLNCDGFINIGDVTSIIDYLLSDDGTQISTKNADVNGDGNINIADVTTLIDILLREE